MRTHVPHTQLTGMHRLVRYTRAGMAACMLTASMWAAPLAYALPQDPTVIAGKATFDYSGDQLAITATDNSVIEFGTYGIGAAESVVYALPSTSASTLSRVIGGQSTEIFGALSVNGTLFLVNTAGILIAPSAVIRAGGFVASAIDIADADFLAGSYRFDAAEQAQLAAVINQGLINVTEGGMAALIGGAASNTGTILAPVGSVALAAGRVVTVGVSADNQIAVAIEMPVAEGVTDINNTPITAQVSSTGTIDAPGGYVHLAAQAAEDIFDLAINQEGVIRADTPVVGQGGVIELVASGAVRSTGMLSAINGAVRIDTPAEIELGGVIDVTGGAATIATGSDLTLVDDLRTVGRAVIQVMRDWVNPDDHRLLGESTVMFTNSLTSSTIYGNNTFYNFSATALDKQLFFESGKTQTIAHDITLRGEKFHLIQLRSTDTGGEQWYLNPFGTADIAFVHIGDAHSLTVDPLKVLPSNSFGNNTNIDTDPVWSHAGGSRRWSRAANWDTGVVPGAFDTVTFDGTSISNADVDAAFGGTIDRLFINPGYTGRIRFRRSLTTNQFTQRDGTVDLRGNTLTVTNNFRLSGGTFDGADGALDINRNFSMSDGFFFSPGGSMSIEGNLIKTGGALMGGAAPIVFDGRRSSVIGTDGFLPAIVEFTKDIRRSISIRAGSLINLGFDPTMTNASISNQGLLFAVGGTWTTNRPIINRGTIFHVGDAWDINSSLTNHPGATINYFGDNLNIENSFTQRGIFDTTGKTLTFDGRGTSVITALGAIPGTVVLDKEVNRTVRVNAGTAISLGVDPTSDNATIDNRGTIVVEGGIWTTNRSITNRDTITHNGAGWDMNNGSLTNRAGATITYAGAGLNIERNLSQLGVFDTAGKIITFDGAHNSTITAAGAIPGTVAINKVGNRRVTVQRVTGINLGDDPTTTAGDIINRGTIDVDSGIWMSNNSIRNERDAVINHNGSSWDINDGFFLNNDGATVNFAGDTMSVERRFSQLGVFDMTGITLTLDGADGADDTFFVANGPIGNMVINKTHAGATWHIGRDITVLGDFTRTDGRVLNSSGVRALRVEGNFRMDTADAFGGNRMTTVFGGGNDQTITQNAGSVNGPVQIDKSANTATLLTNFRTNAGDDLDVVEGAFDLNSHNLTVGGDFTVQDGGHLILEGGETVTDPVFDVGSLATYDGAGMYAGLAAGDVYYDVTFDGAGSWTLDAPVDIDRNLTLVNGTLDISAANHGVTVGGDWTDAGAATFVERDGTVIFDGTGTVSANEAFNHVTVDTAGTMTLGAALDADGDVTIAAGTLDVSAANHGVNVAGDWSNNGVFVPHTGTVTFDGLAQRISGDTTFNNVNKTTAVADTLTFASGSTQTIEGNMTLRGADGALLSLLSDSLGVQWNVDPQGARVVEFLAVQDSHNIHPVEINAVGTGSVDLGNDIQWRFVDPVVVGLGDLGAAGLGSTDADDGPLFLIRGFDGDSDQALLNDPFAGVRGRAKHLLSGQHPFRGIMGQTVVPDRINIFNTLTGTVGF